VFHAWCVYRVSLSSSVWNVYRKKGGIFFEGVDEDAFYEYLVEM
jgi:hypothetical protein